MTASRLQPAVSFAWFCRTASVGLLVAVAITLVPLAHASPVDPTWISGLYDDSDGDDVVLLITNGDAPPIPTWSFITRSTTTVPIAQESDVDVRIPHGRRATERAPPGA